MWKKKSNCFSDSWVRLVALLLLLGFTPASPSLLIAEDMVTIPVSLLDQIEAEIEAQKIRAQKLYESEQQTLRDNSVLIEQKQKLTLDLIDSESFSKKLENQLKWYKIGTAVLTGTTLGLLSLELIRRLTK